MLDVARRLFAESGYDATTNRAIAEASGLTAGALYHYFESKADLYAAVYGQVYDRVYNALDAAIVGHQTLIGQFTAAMTAVGELNVSDPTLPAFDRGVAGEAQVHPELNELLKPVRRRNALFFRRMVAGAASRGELAPDVDLRGLEDLLNAVAFGVARISAVTGDARRATIAVGVLRRFIDGTLVATPATSGVA